MINLNLQPTTGIYVGSRHIYIAQAKGAIFTAQLVKFTKTEIQPLTKTGKPEQEQRQAVVRAIKRAVQENNISVKKVITALAGKDVLIRYFQMPRIPKSEWATAIKFEAKKYIPFKVEDLIWDFHVVLPKGKDKKMAVTFVAVKKETAQNYISLLKEAGLNPVVLEPAPFSLLRLFTSAKQLAKGRPAAIVDVDYGMADINIVKDGICYLTRDVSLPLEEEVVFDGLLNEVRMSLDYYEKLFPAQAVAKILLCGEVKLKDWDKRLAQDLKIPVEQVRPAGAIKIKGAAPPADMSVAVGLALRGAAGVPEVNLCRAREVKPKVSVGKKVLEVTPEVRQAAFRAAIISGIAILALYLVMSQRIAQKMKQLDKIVSSRTEISLPISNLSYLEIENIKQTLDRRLSVLKLIMDKRIFLTNKFNQLPRMIPPGVWLTELSFTEELEKANRVGRSLIIKGVAYDRDPVQQIGIISEFFSRMNKNEEFSRGFGQIKLDAMTSAKLKEVPVKNFTISCQPKKAPEFKEFPEFGQP